MDSSQETETRQSQAARHPQRGSTAAWVGGWTAVITIALWLSHLLAVWLVLAAAGAALWTAMVRRRPLPLAAAAVLWLAIGLATGTQLRLRAIAGDWSTLQAEIEGDAAARLNASLDELVGRGEEAVETAASLVRGRRFVRASAFNRLAEVRRAAGVSALAVLDRDGRPLVWAGEHRGTIPREVLSSANRYVFHQGPLFS